MMLQRPADRVGQIGAKRASDQRCRSKHHCVAERIRDCQSLPQEELWQEDHEAEDQRVDRDQAPAADQQTLQDRRLEHCGSRKLRSRAPLASVAEAFRPTDATSFSIVFNRASASAVRPCASSHRGDSGKFFRRYHTIKEPMPAMMNIGRHPHVGMIR